MNLQTRSTYHYRFRTPDGATHLVPLPFLAELRAAAVTAAADFHGRGDAANDLRAVEMAYGTSSPAGRADVVRWALRNLTWSDVAEAAVRVEPPTPAAGLAAFDAAFRRGGGDIVREAEAAAVGYVEVVARGVTP